MQRQYAPISLTPEKGSTLAIKSRLYIRQVPELRAAGLADGEEGAAVPLHVLAGAPHQRAQEPWRITDHPHLAGRHFGAQMTTSSGVYKWMISLARMDTATFGNLHEGREKDRQTVGVRVSNYHDR